NDTRYHRSQRGTRIPPGAGRAVRFYCAPIARGPAGRGCLPEAVAGIIHTRGARKPGDEAMTAAGIVLCGGRSTRMGVPKATLPFGSETMLQRVVRLLGTVVSPVVVVAAREQSLPELPEDVAVTRDEREQRGPLEGLRAGLSALPKSADIAYVTSCDVPLLVPG